jgi:hypothetical protein
VRFGRTCTLASGGGAGRPGGAGEGTVPRPGAILRGTRVRLVAVQSHTSDVAQILQLGNQIDAVQLQIEQIQGQLNVIANQVAESTVTVQLQERGVDGGTTPTGPSLGSAWHRSAEGFMRVIGAVVIGLGYLIPVLVIVLAAWAVVTLERRRRRAAS